LPKDDKDSIVVDVPCPNCRVVTGQGESSDLAWNCPTCRRNYIFRRCSSCKAVSHVGAALPSRTVWSCVWCETPNHGFRARKDPDEADLGHLEMSIRKGHLAFEPPPPPPEPPSRLVLPPALIVTTADVSGHVVTIVHGDVIGVTSQTLNVFGQFVAGIQANFGGEIGGYTRVMQEARERARLRMWRDAVERGANAVVAMRYDCNDLSSFVEVVAYGTAVTIVADPTMASPVQVIVGDRPLTMPPAGVEAEPEATSSTSVSGPGGA
jgi:uncharacterized protein YbjQ (UPF0145 family)